MTDKPYSLTLAWGQSDEGLYHWAGRAASLDAATQAAREEMDGVYNDVYAKGEDDAWMLRGKAAGAQTTGYDVVDFQEGVNEFAADDMLACLRYIDSVAPAQPGDGSSPLEDEELIELVITGKALKDIRAAIARGEGRV